jgi:hypothetical protein
MPSTTVSALSTPTIHYPLPLDCFRLMVFSPVARSEVGGGHVGDTRTTLETGILYARGTLHNRAQTKKGPLVYGGFLRRRPAIRKDQ